MLYYIIFRLITPAIEYHFAKYYIDLKKYVNMGMDIGKCTKLMKDSVLLIKLTFCI